MYFFLPFGLDPNKSSSDESSPNNLDDFDTVADFIVLDFFKDSLLGMGGGPNKLSSSSLMSSNKLDFGTVLLTLDCLGIVSFGTSITIVDCFDISGTVSGSLGLVIGVDFFLTLPPPKMSSSDSLSSPNRLTCFDGNFGGDSLNGSRAVGISIE